jgi:hypothetical protein
MIVSPSITLKSPATRYKVTIDVYKVQHFVDARNDGKEDRSRGHNPDAELRGRQARLPRLQKSRPQQRGETHC